MTNRAICLTVSSGTKATLTYVFPAVKMYIKANIVFFIIFAVNFQISSGYVLSLEAETGIYPSQRRMQRSAASNQATVLLYQGNQVRVSFPLISQCQVQVKNVAYTNDGPSDTITVLLDGTTTIGSFHTTAHSNHGHYWNVPINSGVLGTPVELSSGSHTISIRAMASDQYGVEIDKVDLDLNCSLDHPQCFNLSASMLPTNSECNSTNNNQLGSITQKSSPTACAEEDNINVPLYYNDILHEYKILATLPIYFEYTNSIKQNNRSPDFTDCSFTSRVIWEIGGNTFSNAPCDAGLYYTNQSDTNICKTFSKNGHNHQEIVFNARGPSAGLVESSIGSIFTIVFSEVQGTLRVKVECWGRENNWIDLGTKTFNSFTRTKSWQIPDLTWSEESLNRVRMTIVTDSTSDASGIFSLLKLAMRNETGETVTNIYDTSNTIIEVVKIDFWWLYPQAMTIHMLNNGQQWTNVSYFRIYRRIPYTTKYAQVFVLYQDGNARILTFPPTGYDWIPFGSSVIIGPTDPNAHRPHAAISRVDINPYTLSLTVHYVQGGKADLLLKSQTGRTEVKVTGITYMTNSAVPFATFRSMWVRDGNADVDHVATSIHEVNPILSGWKGITGTDVFFFRSCISQHNTLSPDIRVQINECYMPIEPPPTATTNMPSSTTNVNMPSSTTNTPSTMESSTCMSAASSTMLLFCSLLFHYILRLAL